MPSGVRMDSATGSWRDRLLRSLVDCDRDGARAAMEDALSSGMAVDRLLQEVVHPAFDAMGALWEAQEVTLTHQFVAARAVEDALLSYGRPPTVLLNGTPKVVVGTLLDGHSLGAKLVATFLRAAGLAVVEAGEGLTPEQLVGRAVAEQAHVLAVSVLMMRSVARISEVRRGLEAANTGIKLVVGGAPFRFDPGLAERVGADAWAPDAISAANVIRPLLNAGGGGQR